MYESIALLNHEESVYKAHTGSSRPGVCSITELHSIFSQDFVSRAIYYQDRIYRVNSACFDQFCQSMPSRT